MSKRRQTKRRTEIPNSALLTFCESCAPRAFCCLQTKFSWEEINTEYYLQIFTSFYFITNIYLIENFPFCFILIVKEVIYFIISYFVCIKLSN
jgi:hypothetical protein